MVTPVKIKLVSEDYRPTKAHEDDAAYDLRARMRKAEWLYGHCRALIPTGVFLELPSGWEAQVRPRSGLMAKGILVGLGTIDAGYRGEIHVAIFNTSSMSFEIKPGDRIAQLTFHQLDPVRFELTETLTPSQRGAGGIGSTGLQ